MQCLSNLSKNKAHFGATCDIKRKVLTVDGGCCMGKMTLSKK